MLGGLGGLAAAAAFFVGGHLLISGTPMRARLIGLMGEKAYLAAYSVFAAVGLGWMIWAYIEAYNGSDFVEFWAFGLWTHWAASIGMVPAAILVVHGLIGPNPTAVKQERRLLNAEPARGMLRVSRHPFLSGVTLWALLHLLANGDGRGVILFSAVIVLAVGGMASIDGKRRASQGEAWARYAAVTSRMPFAAILAGRQRLVLGEFGIWRNVLALALYGLILVLHGSVFGLPILLNGGIE